MRKIFILILLALSSIGYAQTIKDVFSTVPASILPGLAESTKTMLLVDTGKTTVPYALGEIEKIYASDDYLLLRTSKAGSTQIKLLDYDNDSTVVCVIKTVCAKMCDSYISFYDINWQELPSERFLPTLSGNFFFDSSKKTAENYKYAVSLPDISPIKAEFVNGADDLILVFDYKSYLSDSMAAEVEPFLKSDSIILKWDKSTFK
ncbi:MAG TPA: hypothetical protein DDW85_04215 [Porphyromonadaceae bacterium]|nr:hypothetical protein [Porphyromonadaceae bacterium]